MVLWIVHGCFSERKILLHRCMDLHRTFKDMDKPTSSLLTTWNFFVTKECRLNILMFGSFASVHLDILISILLMEKKLLLQRLSLQYVLYQKEDRSA